MTAIFDAIENNDYEGLRAAIAKDKAAAEDELIIAMDGPWMGVMGDGWKIYDDNGVKVGWGSFRPSIKDAAMSLGELAKLCNLFSNAGNVSADILSMAYSHLTQASENVARRIQENDLDEYCTE